MDHKGKRGQTDVAIGSPSLPFFVSEHTKANLWKCRHQKMTTAKKIPQNKTERLITLRSMGGIILNSGLL